VPQVGQDVHTPLLKLGGPLVLVLVDHVLVHAFGHEHPGLRLHPRSDERGEVQPGVAVQHQLVVDELPGRAGRYRIIGVKRPRDLLGQDRIGYGHKGIGAAPGRPGLRCPSGMQHSSFVRV
jgi:hypothetical protein